MPANGKTPSDVSRVTSLTRIADALGLPVSRFHEVDSNEKIVHHIKLDDAAVLALVKSYLQAVGPADRRHFMDQVRVFVDELST